MIFYNICIDHSIANLYNYSNIFYLYLPNLGLKLKTYDYGVFNFIMCCF